MKKISDTQKGNMLSITQKPDWLKVQVKTGQNYLDLKRMTRKNNLHTVCEEALCPNIFECWEQRSVTLMILGDICTRSCGFCGVETGRPTWNDLNEPQRVAEMVKRLGLRHCVITSVNRDELSDGGAFIWSETIRRIHQLNKTCSVEVLIPDFKGDDTSLRRVFKAKPEILGHNMETIPRLYQEIRPQAKYELSLHVLRESKIFELRTKTSIMLGLGETTDEVISLMEDISKTGCDIVAIGQYLQPTKYHFPVKRYIPPIEFENYRREGLKMGFSWVEAGPLVRSSYHADKQINAMIGS